MTTTAIDFDADSTLIRRGITASTFSEVTDFVEMIERRPLDKLLGDLPGFSRLSETKFKLAHMVLQRRLRELPEVEREQLRIFADDVARGASATVGERVRGLFK